MLKLNDRILYKGKILEVKSFEKQIKNNVLTHLVYFTNGNYLWSDYLYSILKEEDIYKNYHK